MYNHTEMGLAVILFSEPLSKTMFHIHLIAEETIQIYIFFIIIDILMMKLASMINLRGSEVKKL